MVAHAQSTTITRHAAADQITPIRRPAARRRPVVGASLWAVQGLLAALFLFAGAVKFTLPTEVLEAGGVPAAFSLFIGACEVLGALGLILPGATRIRPGLTPLAAAGLVVIMVGATVTMLAMGAGAGVLVPAVAGSLAAAVVYGRTRVAPQRGRARRPVLRPAS
jgi:DoxX-like family